VIRAALIVFAASLGVSAQTAPKLFYSKSFPGSSPAYMEIHLSQAGEVEYREQAGEDNPVLFKLTADETSQVFALADRLGHFDRNLESGLPVAKMGEKTFRWSRGAETREQKFNYSLDPDAQALLDWFEMICESAVRFIDLERVAQLTSWASTGPCCCWRRRGIVAGSWDPTSSFHFWTRSPGSPPT